MAKNINHTGDTTVANNGMQMTIINYRKSDDIDIRFEDNQVVLHKQYSAFKRGQIQHPFVKARNIAERVGESVIAHNGLRMTIVEAYHHNDITVQFEDGLIREHVSYSSFKQGYVKHDITVNDIAIKGFAYIYQGEWYYECLHPDWTELKILSIQEIYNH